MYFRKRTYLKILVSILAALFINYRGDQHFEMFKFNETVRVRGALYGTCSPIE